MLNQLIFYLLKRLGGVVISYSLFLLSLSPPGSVDGVETKLECITLTLHGDGGEEEGVTMPHYIEPLH